MKSSYGGTSQSTPLVKTVDRMMVNGSINNRLRYKLQ
jgi:hypothetical protein